MKLKTLKDMEFYKWHDDEHTTCIVRELRKEAIKEIKKIEELLKNVPEYFKRYSHKKKEGKELPIEAIQGMYRGQISWIKHFFNITEKDLKEVKE